MRMQTTFEKLGGTYRQAGDYLLPDLEVPESPQIGIWGQRRLQIPSIKAALQRESRMYTNLLPYNKTACAENLLRRLNFLQINISETKLELFGINPLIE